MNAYYIFLPYIEIVKIKKKKHFKKLNFRKESALPSAKIEHKLLTQLLLWGCPLIESHNHYKENKVATYDYIYMLKLTLADFTVRSHIFPVTMVTSRLRAIRHCLFGTILSVMEIKHVTNITEKTWGWTSRC